MLRFVHLLSLDAVAVALCWQAALGAGQSWRHRAALGLAVWAVYLGDRWLDARRLRDGPITDRHAFHARHAPLLGATAAVAAPAALALGYTALAPAELHAAIALTAVTAVYLVLNQLRRPVLIPREVAVGVVFALGCSIGAPAQRWPTVALLAAACVGNCLLIGERERSIDRAQGIPSWTDAHPALRRALTPLLAIGAISAAALAPTGGATMLALCAAFVALALVRRNAARCDTTTAHVLADAALLTPVPLLAARLLR